MRITNSSYQTKKPGKANPVLLGIIFIISGGPTFFLFALPPLQYANTSKTWPSVSGEVIKSEIDTWKKDGKTQFQAHIVYRYSVNGKNYTSSKITVGDPPSVNNITTAKRIITAYPVDKKVDIFYDPEVPSSSALKPGIQKNDLLLAGITGLFLVVGILLFISGLKAKINQLNYGDERRNAR